MAIEVIATVMKYDLPPREKYVLMLYSNYANPEGSGVWPSQSTIAKMSGYSRQTINKVTKILEKSGLLLPDADEDRKTKTWKVNIGWAGDREVVERIASDVNTSLPDDVKTSLHTPVNSGLHNTSDETSEDTLSNEDFWNQKHQEVEQRPKAKRMSKEELTAASLGIGTYSDFAEFPAVQEKLDLFMKKFPHIKIPNSSVKKKFVKQAEEEWANISLDDLRKMCDYVNDREEWCPTQPRSITSAYNLVRGQQQQTTTWRAGK